MHWKGFYPFLAYVANLAFPLTFHLASWKFLCCKRVFVKVHVLAAYMSFKESHDFVVLEGTNLRGPEDDALFLNTNIAYTVNATSLLVANARRAIEIDDRSVGSDGHDWKGTLLDNIKVNELAFKRSHVDVMGAIVHQLPKLNKNDSSLLNLFEHERISYFGGIPEDFLLQSIQVKDIAATLEAEVLHGTDLSAEVSKFVLATCNLLDLLVEIQKYKDTPYKIVVLTAANRLDVLFGIIQLHNSDHLNNVAAIVVTGGRPPELFDLLLKLDFVCLKQVTEPSLANTPSFAWAKALTAWFQSSSVLGHPLRLHSLWQNYRVKFYLIRLRGSNGHW
eukprot:Gb_37257 [translate_table: standard]